MNQQHPLSPWRLKLHEIIFEADTPLGKLFDIVLLILILLSITAVVLDSVEPIHHSHGILLIQIEWALTIIFTIEYVLRVLSTGKPFKYIFSFYGLVDLFAFLPTYLSLFLAGAPALTVIRVLRLLRVFRVLKLVQFVAEAQTLRRALKASIRKITIFIGAVLSLCVIVGSLMYFVEGTSNPKFSNIPQGIYWAIVTLTTVGYGDIVPATIVGKIFAAFVMIMGYGVIAVPTGIVSVELSKVNLTNTQSCPECSSEGHDDEAQYCKFCGTKL